MTLMNLGLKNNRYKRYFGDNWGHLSLLDDLRELLLMILEVTILKNVFYFLNSYMSLHITESAITVPKLFTTVQ